MLGQREITTADDEDESCAGSLPTNTHSNFQKAWYQLILEDLQNGHWRSRTEERKIPRWLGTQQNFHYCRSSTPIYHALLSRPGKQMVVNILQLQSISSSCCLLSQMKEVDPTCLNFLNKKDPRFKQLGGTLDVLFHKLHSEGSGTKVKSADVFTQEDELKLWSNGVLSLNTPKCCLLHSGEDVLSTWWCGT